MTDGAEAKSGIGFGTIIGGGAALLALIFIVQNTGSGTVRIPVLGLHDGDVGLGVCCCFSSVG